jgi:hypothetical protein
MMRELERIFLNVTIFKSYDGQDQEVDYFGVFLWHLLILYLTIIACLAGQSFRDYFFYVSSLCPLKRMLTPIVKERDGINASLYGLEVNAKIPGDHITIGGKLPWERGMPGRKLP